MANNIYIGIDKTSTSLSENVFPSEWTDVSPSDKPYTSYIASDGSGIKLTASGTFSEERQPIYAFDGDTSTSWLAGSDHVTKLLCVEFPTPRRITTIKTYFSDASSTKSAVIEGSVDGETWVTLRVINSAQSSLTSVTLNNQGDYKFYRIRCVYSSVYTVPEFQAFETITTKTGIARKVTKAYIGIAGKARKIKKAYIGVDGKAHLFYTTEVIKSFSSNIFPTTWTDSSDYTSATGSNTYGTWKIYTDNVMYDSSGYKVSNAFDNNDSTVHRLMLALEGALRYVEIYLPSGVTICPSRFSMTYKLIASNYTERADSYIQGRTTSGYWVNLVEIPPLYEEDTETLSVSTSSYYTAFRFGCARYSDDEKYGSIAEIKLTRGSIKYST